MIGTVILTHGGVARELLAAVEKIVGEPEGFTAVCLDWDDECAEAEEKIRAGIARVDTGAGVLVLTDTYGGTPCNLAMHFRELGKVEVVSGVNLPMVVRLACNGNCRPAELEEIAAWLQDKTRQSIRVGGPEPAGTAAAAAAPAVASATPTATTAGAGAAMASGK